MRKRDLVKESPDALYVPKETSARIFNEEKGFSILVANSAKSLGHVELLVDATPALRSVAKHARLALLTGVGSLGDLLIRLSIRQLPKRSRKESFRAPKLCQRVQLSRKFGVVQNDKVRPIRL